MWELCQDLLNLGEEGWSSIVWFLFMPLYVLVSSLFTVLFLWHLAIITVIEVQNSINLLLLLILYYIER